MRAILMTGLAAALAAATAADAKTHTRKPKPPAPAYLLHISSHLAENAKVSVDGGAPVTAPGYGSADAPITAGKHSLKITSPEGVSYTRELNLDPATLFVFRGKRYWCVNLLETALDRYSQEECQQDVSDRG